MPNDTPNDTPNNTLTFEEIYAQNYQEALQYAYQRNRLRECDIEQIVANAFFDLYKEMQTETEIRRPLAWLRKAIRVGFAGELRYQSCLKRDTFGMQRLPLADIAIEHHDFDAIDTDDMLTSVLSHLTDPEHDTLKLVYFEQLDNIKAAEQTGTTQGAFQRKVSRIRHKCRKLRDVLA